MTTEKMPEVINITVSKNAVGVKDYQVSKLKPNTRYLRAEPVEELLKQCIPYLYNAENCELIIDINKFLGEK